MREIGSKIKCMAKEFINGMMGGAMKEIIT